MKREEISKLAGAMDQQYIQEAEDYQAGSRLFGRAGGVRKRMAAAAAVLVCVFAACVPSAARSLLGYFRDTVRWNGVVTGMEYQAGEHEIEVRAVSILQEKEKLLSVQMQFSDRKKAPYRELETGEAALGDYRIMDEAGKVIASAEGLQEEAVGKVENGKVTVRLALEDEELAAGRTYRLVIESFYGLKKADQPLKINGYWECSFLGV